MKLTVVVFTSAAVRQLDKLPKVIRARMYRLVERLGKWPDVSGAKALTGNLAGKYRLRTGDYRLLFHVEAERLVIERIGHRDDFYEG